MLIDKINEEVKRYMDAGAILWSALIGVKKFAFSFTMTYDWAMDAMIFISTFASMLWLVIRAVNAIISFVHDVRKRRDEKKAKNKE